jgi:tight adherence protein B
MSVVLIVTMLTVLGLASMVLYQDARAKRVEQQLATVLTARAVTKPAPFRMRSRVADSTRHRYWHKLLCYDAEAPNKIIFFVISLLASLAAGLGGYLLLPGWVVPFDAALTGGLTLRGLFGWQRNRYADKMLRQLPDVLGVLVGALRAGVPVVEAIRIVSLEIAEPTQEQFRRVVDDLKLGRTADDALLGVYHRTRVEEYAMFSVTLAVQSKAGGRLTETVQTLCDTIRERVGLAGRAKALAGEAKLSARVLISLPILSLVFMYFERRDSLMFLLFDARGQTMSSIGVTLMILGILTMRRMIRKGTAV